MNPSGPKNIFNGVVKRAVVQNSNMIVFDDEQGQQLALSVKSLRGFESRSLSHLVGSRVSISGHADAATLYIDELKDITVKVPKP